MVSNLGFGLPSSLKGINPVTFWNATVKSLLPLWGPGFRSEGFTIVIRQKFIKKVQQYNPDTNLQKQLGDLLKSETLKGDDQCKYK